MKTIPESTVTELQKKFPAALSYLIAIFLIQREYGKVGNTRLAEDLGVSKPAVNQGIGRLKKHGLVEQETYGAIHLTELGRKFAVNSLKKHYLIEHMLIKRLNYPWDRADEEARRLQDAVSQEFADYLYNFFGKPDTCPHGNPFPDSPREAMFLQAPRFIDAPVGCQFRLIRITEIGEGVEGLMQFCHMHSLYPGKVLTVVNRIDPDFIELEYKDQLIRVPSAFARHLCYETLDS